MRVFRAMCEEEAENITESSPLSWKSRFKWFGTEDFVKTRVMDGTFNNSKFKNKYSILCEYEIVEGVEHFSKCGHRELMLDRRKANCVKLRLISKGVYEVMKGTK